MAAIFIVSAQPEAPIPSGVTDKQGHLVAYAGMAVLMVRALAGGLPAPVTIRTATTALAVSVGYGVTDELHQSLVPGRTADPWDLFADATGACLGLLGCWAWGIIGARVND
jgi:VanZ family protein